MTNEDVSGAPEGVNDAALPDGEVDAGQVAVEVDDLADLATAAGWKPKADWKGDATNWVDAKAFLKAQLNNAKQGKETVERTIRATKELMDKQRDRLIRDYEGKLREARAAGDTEAALEAQQAIYDAKSEPDHSVKQAQFLAENPWFESNDEAAAIAVAAAGRTASKGGSAEEQFEAAKKAVRKAMPELFDADLDPVPSKPTPRPPALAGGQRSASPSVSRAKGWGDMPPNVRAEMESNFVRTGDLTREDCAKSYWKLNQ